MFLTAYNLPHYLISKGIVTAQSVVDGDFMVVEAGRRNRNFKVIRRKNPGLFVKQMKSTEAQAVATLKREAGFYRALESNPNFAQVREVIPRLVDFDERRNALTVSLVSDAESISERQMRVGIYEEDTARLLGEVLGRVHAQGALVAADPAARSLFTYQPPWPLMFDVSGLQFLEKMGAIGPVLAAAIPQTPSLQPMLTALRSRWQYDSLVHGDMKWDNCLIRNHASGTPELILVDWEIADIGDGAWDIAGILKEYVMAVLMNINGRQMAAMQNTPAPPPLALESLQPAVRAFWSAYAATRRLPDPAAYFDRAVRLTGARMVVAVLEYLFNQAQLGTLGTMMLQSSANILQAPQIAAVQLMGTPAT